MLSGIRRAWPLPLLPFLLGSRALLAAVTHHVPDGFEMEKVAGSPEVVFPMFAAFDKRGRLFVAESSGLDLYAELIAQTRKCRVRLLEDRDGDGRFESAKVFADQLVFPMGIVCRDEKVYVPDPPDLVVYQDTNQDGKADSRQVILSGFGHKDNGSLHGLTFGPDGWLYMTMGNPDGYRLRRSDGTILQGQSGALLRCRPDGSVPEVLCRGFENLVEVVFTLRGDMIGTDNWFQRPSGGLRDALVHLVEGGLYPLHNDLSSSTPQPITGEPLPPISLYPAVALSGLTLYRGQAFPPEMRDNLFSAQHNARKVGRHILLPLGATFRTEEADFVGSDDPDFHPSDVLEDADGSLLVVDTGGWYVQHCPTGKIRPSQAPGGIYRVRFKAAPRVADPWGLQLNWTNLSARQVTPRLEDTRPAVRDRAQRWLASRSEEALEAIGALLANSTNVMAKQHALWALSTSANPAALPLLRTALADAEPGLAIAAARALALRADVKAAPELCRLLSSESAAVRLAAAQALAHCGEARSLPALWKALAEENPDRFLEHALIHALHRTADKAALESALQERHPRVQKAALVLLDQPPRSSLAHQEVLARVSAADAGLRQTALHILQKHPEWAGQALEIIQARLKKPSLLDEEKAGLRSLILAFQAQTTVQQLIGKALSDRALDISSERCRFLLEVLAESSLRQIPDAWISGLALALADADLSVRTQAARTAGVLQIAALDEQLMLLADDQRASPELRLESLRAVVARRPKVSPVSFALLLAHVGANASPLHRLTAAEILGRSQISAGDVQLLLAAVREDVVVSPRLLLPALLRFNGEAFVPIFDYLAAAIRRGWRPAEQELQDIVSRLPDALQDRGRSLVQFVNESRAGEGSRLAMFEPLLSGGNEERGRAVFFGIKAPCATCHRIGAQGGLTGPDLTKIGAVRSGRDLIESIVFPSSTFAQGYETHSVVLKEGDDADGIIVRQSAETLVLRDSAGAEKLFRKDEIKELKRKDVSIMPEGLENALSVDEFRDLLAFLLSLK